MIGAWLVEPTRWIGLSEDDASPNPNPFGLIFERALPLYVFNIALGEHDPPIPISACTSCRLGYFFGF